MCVYWSTVKDLDTTDTGKVWDSIWSDTNIHGNHLRILKIYDIQGAWGKKLVKKRENTSCLKLPEITMESRPYTVGLMFCQIACMGWVIG